MFREEIEQKLNSIHNYIQGLGTSIAAVDTTDIVGKELEWGCSVFFQNELLVFGVHESSPDWSSVSNNVYLVDQLIINLQTFRF